MLRIDDKYFILGNNPELAEIVSRNDVQEFIKRMLFDIDDSVKDFIREGHEKYYNDLIKQLRNSYSILDSEVEDKKTTLVKKVRRCFDGSIFKICDEIIWGNNIIKIGRMYVEDIEDDLKIRLDFPNKNFCWAKLSDIKLYNEA